MAQNFDTPEGVTNVLYTIFFWAANGYISERKAGVLTYIAQTILNSQRVNVQLQKLEAAARDQAAWDSGPAGCIYTQSADADAASLPESAASPSANHSDLPISDPAASPELGPSVHTELQRVPTEGSAPPPSSSIRALQQPPHGSQEPGPKTPSPPPLDLNHFYPRDPTLPPGLQNPHSYSPPPLACEVLDRRNVRFNRIHGFPPASAQRSHPREQDSDWKIINGK